MGEIFTVYHKKAIGRKVLRIYLVSNRVRSEQSKQKEVFTSWYEIQHLVTP